MIYRVLYKKWSDMQKALLLVEEDIEAADFTIVEGCLVFYDDDGKAITAKPPTFWAHVERVSPAPLVT